MPTLREKIAGLLRQIPPHTDNSKIENLQAGVSSQAGSTPQESFIQKYLNGQLKRNQPEIIFGKCCYDLPMKKVAKLSKVVLAAHTGPAGGLTQVNRKQKPFEYLDLDVDFIDEDYEGSSENINKLNIEESNAVENKEKINEQAPVNEKITSVAQDFPDEIAGIKNWNQPDERAYGTATSLYEKHPVTNANAGEPVADAFAVCLRENSAVLVLADGVNWGEKSCLAARCAVHGCMDYLNNALYREGGRIETTMDIFVCLLRSFHAAHNLILQEEGNLTTLCAAVVCQLRNSDKFIVCTCNVGDSLAYVYSQKHGVREITQGSHDINSMRDMRDALGALGPVDGVNPELNNLTVSMTIVEQGDYLFLCSDGISDNFDPVVGKFAIPKRPEKVHRKASDVGKPDSSKHSNGSVKRQNSNSQEVTVKRQNSKLESMLRRQSNSSADTVNKRSSVGAPEPSLPVVEAHQRHQLTLLRMEDLLNNGQNDNDKACDSAQKLCDILIDFAMKLTVAKRKILEDPELYQNGEPDSQQEQRSRRRKVGDKLCTVPGKLDHASVVACRIGNYKPHSPVRRNRDSSKSHSKSPVASSNKSKSSGHHHHHSRHHHHHHHQSNVANNNNNNINAKVSRGMKTEDHAQHFESSI
ncbi:PP2C-like domain-containing protein CG9801 [Stegodyphus dumicola]|uniref:PP2C-like domain-containing protein CG9801 n=1 Tax=Stegodyphus dumicola TaxID=202533 RepID=UPI0015A9DB37|nr:PP2C-like domain-containing protein CG9801 [Stegodyphus dumicola]